MKNFSSFAIKCLTPEEIRQAGGFISRYKGGRFKSDTVSKICNYVYLIYNENAYEIITKELAPEKREIIPFNQLHTILTGETKKLPYTENIDFCGLGGEIDKKGFRTHLSCIISGIFFPLDELIKLGEAAKRIKEKNL